MASGSAADLKIGDVVLLVEQNSPRDHWQLARNMVTYPGADGHQPVSES